MKGALFERFRHWALGMDIPYARLSTSGKFARIIWVSFRRYAADQHGQRATMLTYYTLFAIVPVAALVFGIAKGFSLQARLEVMLTKRFADHQDILNWICQFADTTLERARGGIVAGAGVIALIWTVMWLATNIEKAFNQIWNLPTRRNFFRRFSDYLAIILLTPIILVVLGSAGVLVSTMFNRILSAAPWLSSLGMIVFSLGMKLFPLLLVCLIFSAIYFMVPNTRVKIGAACFGGLIAGILYQLLQDGFVFLQGTIYRYNTIYGSFAALPLFLIWVQWSWQITLLGAEIAFVKQHAGTGLFDRSSEEESSLRVRRDSELALAKIVYRNFADGKGATSCSELFRRMPIPAVVLQRYLCELTAAGILLRVENRGDGEEPCFTPGRPTETFTVCDGLEQLDTAGNNQPDPAAVQELTGVEICTRQLRDAACRSTQNRPLREL